MLLQKWCRSLGLKCELLKSLYLRTSPVMADVPPLLALPTELLVHIFQYLDVVDLGNLRVCSDRFREIIDDNKYLFKESTADLIVTSDHNKVAYARSPQAEFSIFEKHKLSHNWLTGSAIQRPLLPTKVKYMPWLLLDKESLWISRGQHMMRFNRTDKIIDREPSLVITPERKVDVCRYIIKEGFLVAAQMSGGLFMHNLKTNSFYAQYNCHHSDVEDVDLYKGLMVTGSRDCSIRVWTNLFENPRKYTSSHVTLPESVWCVALYKHEHVAIGTMGISHICGGILDLHTATTIMMLQNGPRVDGAGIKQVKWHTDTVFWTCGYDGTVRKWDLRIGHLVKTFRDPCNSSIYCFDTDNRTTLLTGSESNGRVALWDVRMKKCLQLYYMDTCKGRWSSPVYSLAYDPNYLFAATQNHLNVLDFTSNSVASEARDWRSFLRYKCSQD